MKNALRVNFLLTFTLIVLGGTVRNFNAGLSCPDWPLCHGKLIPPFDLEIFLEWFHRLVASTVGFLTLGICVVSLYKKEYRKPFGLLSVIALALVILQAVLGGMTVIGLLAPKWVASHLAVGLLFLLMILWMYLRLQSGLTRDRFSGGLRQRAVGPNSPAENLSRVRRLWILLTFVTLLVYLQTVLGGFVSATGAGLACPDFPTCMGQWIPPLSPLVGLQFFHRVIAFLILFAAMGLYLVSRTLRKSSGFILWVIGLQILLGMGNVLFKLPKPMSITHLFMATLLVALLFDLAYKVKHAALS